MSNRSAQDPEENLPDWLKALRDRQNPEGAPLEPESPSEQSAAPSGEESASPEPVWLQEIRKRYRHDTPEDAHQRLEPELSDTQPGEPIPVEPEVKETPEPEEEQTPIAEAWGPEPGEKQQPAFHTDPEVEQPEPSGFTPAFIKGEEGDETLTPGELPSWLQAIRPGGSFPKEDARSDQILPGSQGPLAGLSGILPSEPEITQIGKSPIFSARLEVNENQRLHAAAFKHLLDQEGKPSEDVQQRIVLPTRLLSLVMGAVLFLAILFPLITQTQRFPPSRN